MPERVPDLAKLLRSVSEHDCRYVLIGGMANILHGGAEVTFDCDLAIAFEPENVRRVVAALAPFRPRPSRGTVADFVWDERSIVGPWTLYETDVGRVDLVVQLFGVDSFQGLYSRALEAEFAGTKVRYASLRDLLAMKRAADRGKDSSSIRYLESLLSEVEEGVTE